MINRTTASFPVVVSVGIVVTALLAHRRVLLRAWVVDRARSVTGSRSLEVCISKVSVFSSTSSSSSWVSSSSSSSSKSLASERPPIAKFNIGRPTLTLKLSISLVSLGVFVLSLAPAPGALAEVAKLAACRSRRRSCKSARNLPSSAPVNRLEIVYAGSFAPAADLRLAVDARPITATTLLNSTESGRRVTRRNLAPASSTVGISNVRSPVGALPWFVHSPDATVECCTSAGV